MTTTERPVTSQVWGARAAEIDEPSADLLTMYFHLARGEEPPPLGTPEAPPDGTRVWRPEDWFDTPAERMFAPCIGDCQPRSADGGVLRTEERLAIAAATAATSGRPPIGAWTAVEVEDPKAVLWIESASGGAVPVSETEEPDTKRALRDLPGKHGYGRARGTEDIDRPDQEARTNALSLRIEETARGSGIDLERDERRADPGELPSLTEHDDGGVTMRLTGGWTGQPSTPDLFEEATAVAIGRAYQKAGPVPDRLERATIAGIVAGHQLVQTAGLKTMAVTHGETVARWRKTVKSVDPGAADRAARNIVELAQQVETDMALPRTERQIQQWDERRAARRERAATTAGETPDGPRPPSRTAPPEKPAPRAVPVRRSGAPPGGARPDTPGSADRRRSKTDPGR